MRPATGLETSVSISAMVWVRFVRRLVREESLAFHPPGESAEESRGSEPGGPTV